MSKSKKTKNNESAEADVVVNPQTSRPDPLDRFDRFGLGEFAQWPAWFGRHWPDRVVGEFAGLADHIKVEQFVEDDKLIVRGEIPGVDPDEDIEISVDNGRLSIHAKRESRTETKSDTSYRSEFHYGSFSRVIALPEEADVDDIDATYVDGILEVTVPLEEVDQPEPRKVEISRA